MDFIKMLFATSLILESLQVPSDESNSSSGNNNINDEENPNDSYKRIKCIKKSNKLFGPRYIIEYHE